MNRQLQLLGSQLLAGLTAFAQTDEERAAESFRDFVTAVNPQYRWARHTEILASVIERVVADALRRVMVLMPPRRSKSETITRLGAAYYLRKHPERYVGIASYVADIAEALSRDARRYWLSSFGQEIDLGDALARTANWETGLGGGCWGSGTYGAQAGKGWSLGIVDDPHKNLDEVRSYAMQKSNHDWWEGVWLGRMAPNAATIIVTNRWAPDDMVGWLLEQERIGATRHRWHIVVLDEEHIDTFEAPPGCTVEPDWREVGEPLWPERYPDVVETRAGVGRLWSAVYQQRPLFDVPGALWNSDLVESMRVARIPEGVLTARAEVGVDPAATHGERSDETGICGAILGSDGNAYIVADRSGKYPPERWACIADDVAMEIGAREITPESNNGGEMIRATFRAAGIDQPVALVASTKSKMVRAEPIAALCAGVRDEDRPGRVKIVGSFPKLEQEMCSYTGIGKSPNRLDAMVICLTKLCESMLAEPVPERRAVWGR